MPDPTARGPGPPTPRPAPLQSQLDSLLPPRDNFRGEIGTLRTEVARLKAAPPREA